MVSFWIPYFQYPFFPSTVGTSDRKRHPLICVTHRRLHFYFDPEKRLHPTLQTSHISPNLLAKYSSLTFPICFCILLGYVALFWQNLASSKPMSAISLGMGCCQVVCLTERPWPRLGAWLCRLGVTINCDHAILFNTRSACHLYYTRTIEWMNCITSHIYWHNTADSVQPGMLLANEKLI